MLPRRTAILPVRVFGLLGTRGLVVLCRWQRLNLDYACDAGRDGGLDDNSKNS